MKNINPKINGKTLDIFDAEMLDNYSIGPCDFENGYIIPPSATFPIILAGKVGVRSVSITLDFSGDTRHERTLTISKFTQLLQDGCELLMPDGFFYTCVFKSSSSPQEKSPWITQVNFSLIAVRHSALKTEIFTTGTSVLKVEGNCNSPAIIKIKATDTEVTVCGFTVKNIKGEVIINGMDGTVLENGLNKYGDIENMTKFPEFSAGNNTIEVVGKAEVKISYYPIFR